MKWEQLETSIHQTGRWLRVLRLQLSIHFLCCSAVNAGIASLYPWPLAAAQWIILGQQVCLKNASFPPKWVLIYPSQFLKLTCHQIIQSYACTKAVCAQPETEGGQLCWSMWNPTSVCIPNLSSQHSQQLKEDHCKISVASKMKQALLHGWVISITLWSVYAQF